MAGPDSIEDVERHVILRVGGCFAMSDGWPV